MLKKLLPPERFFWLLVCAGLAILAYQRYTSAEMWKLAATRAVINPQLKVRLESNGSTMQEVADLPCGERVTLWTLE
jgi:hypothetical protein